MSVYVFRNEDGRCSQPFSNIRKLRKLLRQSGNRGMIWKWHGKSFAEFCRETWDYPTFRIHCDDCEPI